MNITKQITENECGICVINSFIDHFYKYSDKNRLLSEANITQNGINIIEFENICLNNGLLADTYEATIEDIRQLKSNSYFVIMINSNNCNHYVIAKKYENFIKIFDSDKGIYNLTYSELENIFLCVLIIVTKANIKQKLKIKSNKWWENIDIKYLFLMFTLNLLVTGLSICLGLFMNNILSLCIDNENIKNLVIICFSFFLIHLLKELINIISNKLCNKKISFNYAFIKNKLLQNLLIKKQTFINKINPNYFCILNDAIYSTCIYNLQLLANLITDIFIVVLTTILLCINSLYFLLIVSIVVLFEIFTALYKIKFNSDYNDKKINNQSMISLLSTRFKINFNLSNGIIYEKNLHQINKEFHKSFSLNLKQNIFNMKTNSISNIFAYLINLIITGVCVICIWNFTNFTIGKMLFVINTFSIMTNSIYNISDFFSKRDIYKKMLSILLMFIEIDNVDNSSQTKIDKIQTIKINNGNENYIIKNNTPICQELLTNTLTAVHSYSKKLTLYINDINIKNINQKYINSMVCYVDSKIEYLLNDLNYKLIHNDQFIVKTMKQFNINLSIKLNSKQMLIVNMLSLLQYSNKLIIFDNHHPLFNDDEWNYVVKEIFTRLSKNNFVLFKN